MSTRKRDYVGETSLTLTAPRTRRSALEESVIAVIASLCTQEHLCSVHSSIELIRLRYGAPLQVQPYSYCGICGTMQELA